jgi:hypothetical protein
MLRICSRVIAFTAMATCGLVTAQAADPTLTLACQGTTTVGMEDAKPEPISMGIIVNFTDRTVQGGFGYPPVFYDFPVKITSMNEATVVFHGSNQTGQWSITGSIDRVTGDVEAKTEGPTSIHYALKCRPAQRMF